MASEELSLNKQIFSKSREGDEIIEIYLDLGGATSSDKDASITLLDSGGSSLAKLKPKQLGKGHYLSSLSVLQLPEVNYQVLLEYPHVSLGDFPPYFQRYNRKSKFFVVVP